MALVTELKPKTEDNDASSDAPVSTLQPTTETVSDINAQPVEQTPAEMPKEESEVMPAPVAPQPVTPQIQSITPGSASAVEEKKETPKVSVKEEDESIMEKIDDGLKAIDTPGEYVVVTLVALLVGIIVGLILSSI